MMDCDLCRCSFWAGESRTCELGLWRRNEAELKHKINVGYRQTEYAARPRPSTNQELPAMSHSLKGE